MVCYLKAAAVQLGTLEAMPLELELAPITEKNLPESVAPELMLPRAKARKKLGLANAKPQYHFEEQGFLCTRLS